MEGMIKAPEMRAKSTMIDISKFIPNNRWPEKDEEAIKHVFNECTNLIKILNEIRSKMKAYDNKYQEDIYTKANDFEQSLKRLKEMSTSLDNITIPPELVGMIKFDLEHSQSEEAKEADISQRESVLKLFHQELYDRVLFSTQLARGTNNSLKMLEQKMNEKVQKMMETI